MRMMKVKSKKFLKSKKGFTLVELITAMAVMSIVTLAYFSLFFTGDNTYKVVYDGYKIQNEARVAMTFLTVKIRQNDQIIIDPDTMTERNAVILKDLSGNRYMQVNGDTVEYIYPFSIGAGKSLMITDNEAHLFTSSGRVVAEGMSDIKMEYDPFDSNKITVTISYENGGINKVEETIVLRSRE